MVGTTIRVVLVDGDMSFRWNLRDRLAQTDDIRVIAETKSEGPVFELMAQRQPDVVVVAAQIPSSKQVELVRQLRAEQSTTGILVLVLSEDTPAIKAAIDAGANGYVFQSSPIEEFIEAVRAVHEANQVCVQIRRCAPRRRDANQ